jgi:hypothetical protein
MQTRIPKTKLKRMSYSQLKKAGVAISPTGDADRDGVPNSVDCRPLDPTKHGKPNPLMIERIKKLPIYYTSGTYPSKDVANPKKQTHILSPTVPKKAKNRFLSVVKQYPSVIGEIERKKPSFVELTTKPLEYTKREGRVVYGKAVAPIAPYLSKKAVKEHPRLVNQYFMNYYLTKTGSLEGLDEWLKGRKRSVIVSLVPENPSKKGKISGRDIDSMAGTLFHELKHVEQGTKWGFKTKLSKRMKKGVYEKRPEELQAEAAAEKKIEERRDVPLSIMQPATLSEINQDEPYFDIRTQQAFRQTFGEQQ